MKRHDIIWLLRDLVGVIVAVAILLVLMLAILLGFGLSTLID
ncbi:MAG TPA: hypothetical protein VK631_13040 [Solirubrobacteraceae bacterium]|nr:hypothetical protein [Solirubrobacteraceae bacterium]